MLHCMCDIYYDGVFVSAVGFISCETSSERWITCLVRLPSLRLAILESLNTWNEKHFRLMEHQGNGDFAINASHSHCSLVDPEGGMQKSMESDIYFSQQEVSPRGTLKVETFWQ
ncbi:hypothetical protein N7G274_008031 [Stereocaulon virgatum]|uniref:Uncharacterized protein n=1 Tax=Stereocaulon virgatum TaxID=373712 RepID=A0ABR4A2V1_9LECA